MVEAVSSSLVWYHKSIVKMGYRRSNADHTMFIKRANDKIIILMVYVDEMVVTGDDPYELSSLKAHLARELEIKDLGSTILISRNRSCQIK